MGKIRKAKQHPNKKSQNIKSDCMHKIQTKDTKNNKLPFEKKNESRKIINKKTKLKNKKKNLLKKIDLIKEQQKKEIAKKKREKTVITGDLEPLKDALPSLDEILKLKTLKFGLEFKNQQTDNKEKLNKTKKIGKRKEEFMNRYRCFQTLLKDPDYRKNPRETIAFHIRNINNLET